MIQEQRRASEGFVRGLRLPPASSIRDLAPEIERRTGRAVELQPAELDWSAPCGMWVATKSRHIVFFDPRTTLAHQDHIIAHEFAHMLRNHKGGASIGGETVGGLLPDLDPELIQMVLGRTQYDEKDEMEAELDGSYLQAHIHASQRRVISQRGESEVDRRVARTFLRGRE
ncbi:hypothetical protein ACFYZ9_28770 [Streptomyces sp. NPDC001691]|uniref:hypothetical protein n=1 Tax=Streptomyces sp. NPDC001691 TaxID=3364600 RepID=UPI0036A1ED7F